MKLTYYCAAGKKIFARTQMIQHPQPVPESGLEVERTLMFYAKSKGNQIFT